MSLLWQGAQFTPPAWPLQLYFRHHSCDISVIWNHVSSCYRYSIRYSYRTNDVVWLFKSCIVSNTFWVFVGLPLYRYGNSVRSSVRPSRMLQEAPLPRRAQRVRHAYSWCTLWHLSETNNRSTANQPLMKLAKKPTEFREITQNNGHYNVQGRSRSPILVPTESRYTTSY